MQMVPWFPRHMRSALGGPRSVERPPTSSFTILFFYIFPSPRDHLSLFFSVIVAWRFPYTPNNVQITDFRLPFVSNWHLSQNGAASLQNSGSGTGKLQVSTSKMGFRRSEGPGAALAWAAGRGEFACSIKSEKKCVKIGTLRTKPG